MEPADASELGPSTARSSLLTWFRTPAYDDLLHAYTGLIPDEGETKALCGHIAYADELESPATGRWEICLPCQEAADPRMAVRRARAEYRNQYGRFKDLVGESNPFDYPSSWSPTRHLPLTGFRDEGDLADRILARLSPWFDVSREVTGTLCDGTRLRIDAIIRSRPVCPPPHKDVTFGIEFKKPENGDGLKYFTGWVAQAIDYTHVDWDGFGRILVFTCPPVLDNFGGLDRVDVLERVMGQLGVGQLGLFGGYGLMFVLNGHRIWSEREGFMRKNWSLKRKAGSR